MFLPGQASFPAPDLLTLRSDQRFRQDCRNLTIVTSCLIRFSCPENVQALTVEPLHGRRDTGRDDTAV